MLHLYLNVHHTLLNRNHLIIYNEFEGRFLDKYVYRLEKIYNQLCKLISLWSGGDYFYICAYSSISIQDYFNVLKFPC